MKLRDRVRRWLGIADEKPRPSRPMTEWQIDKPRDPYRYPLQLPALPAGVKRADMAMDDAGGGGFPNLGYLNAGTVAFGLYFPGYPWLAELAQRSEYRQPTETTAKELTRKWITFKSKGTSDKTEKIRQIENAFTEFNVREVFRKAATHDGFYGVGHVYVDIRGADKTLPLIIEAETLPKDSLLGFKNIEPVWCTPLVWNSTDPTAPDFYKPTAWMVLGQRIDASRMMQFISREVPDIIKPAYNFGGISLTQLISPYVDRWLRTADAVNRLICNFSIIFLQMDMTAALQEGNNQGVLARIRNFTKTRDNIPHSRFK